MASSDDGCPNCIILLQRIEAMEQRINTLRDINEGEEFLREVEASLNTAPCPVRSDDSVVSFGPRTPTGKVLEDTIPWIPPTRQCQSSTPSIQATQGRLKNKDSKRLSHHNSNKRLQLIKQAAAHRLQSSNDTAPPSRCLPTDLPLSNRFDILSVNDFPPLNAQSSPLPQPYHAHDSYQPSHGAPTQPPPLTIQSPSSNAQLPPPPRPRVGSNTALGRPNNPAPPTVLLAGTSMVRHVAVRDGRTFCYPGARVTEVTSSALQLCAEHSSASTLVLQAGTNDIKFQQSEILKKHFVDSIDCLLDTGKQLIISGPLPAPRFSDVPFSRLYQLHMWLKGYCLTKSIPFVDNFTTFLNRPHLFKRDRLHPNQQGSWLLSFNIDLTIRSSSKSKTD